MYATLKSNLLVSDDIFNKVKERPPVKEGYWINLILEDVEDVLLIDYWVDSKLDTNINFVTRTLEGVEFILQFKERLAKVFGRERIVSFNNHVDYFRLNDRKETVNISGIKIKGSSQDDHIELVKTLETLTKKVSVDLTNGE